jgi:hypothetical protein
VVRYLTEAVEFFSDASGAIKRRTREFALAELDNPSPI